jgi:hypothetical protein
LNPNISKVLAYIEIFLTSDSTVGASLDANAPKEKRSISALYGCTEEFYNAQRKKDKWVHSEYELYFQQKLTFLDVQFERLLLVPSCHRVGLHPNKNSKSMPVLLQSCSFDLASAYDSAF